MLVLRGRRYQTTYLSIACIQPRPATCGLYTPGTYNWYVIENKLGGPVLERFALQQKLPLFSCFFVPSDKVFCFGPQICWYVVNIREERGVLAKFSDFSSSPVVRYLFRGTIVNRTYGTKKNLDIYLFLLATFISGKVQVFLCFLVFSD